VDQGLLIVGASRLHSVKHTTLGSIPCTSDQPDTETSTWQLAILNRDRKPGPQRDSNP